MYETKMGIIITIGSVIGTMIETEAHFSSHSNFQMELLEINGCIWDIKNKSKGEGSPLWFYALRKFPAETGTSNHNSSKRLDGPIRKKGKCSYPVIHFTS